MGVDIFVGVKLSCSSTGTRCSKSFLLSFWLFLGFTCLFITSQKGFHSAMDMAIHGRGAPTTSR